MEYYVLLELFKKKYDYFYIGLTFDSIINFIDEVEKKLDKDGIILIDQLLTTGNGKNRFLKFSVSNGKIDFSSAENLEVEFEYYQLAYNKLREHPEFVLNSILTNEQKEKILSGDVFQ